MYKKIGVQLVVSHGIASNLLQIGIPLVTRDENAIAERYKDGPGSTHPFGPRGEKLALGFAYADILTAGFFTTNFSLFKKGDNTWFQIWFAKDGASLEVPIFALHPIKVELHKRRPVHLNLNPDGSAVISAPCPGQDKRRSRQLRMSTDGEFTIQDLDGKLAPERLASEVINDFMLSDEFARLPREEGLATIKRLAEAERTENPEEFEKYYTKT